MQVIENVHVVLALKITFLDSIRGSTLLYTKYDTNVKRVSVLTGHGRQQPAV